MWWKEIPNRFGVISDHYLSAFLCSQVIPYIPKLSQNYSFIDFIRVKVKKKGIIVFQIELFKYFFVIDFSNCELFKFIFNSFEETKIIMKRDIEKIV